MWKYRIFLTFSLWMNDDAVRFCCFFFFFCSFGDFFLLSVTRTVLNRIWTSCKCRCEARSGGTRVETEACCAGGRRRRVGPVFCVFCLFVCCLFFFFRRAGLRILWIRARKRFFALLRLSRYWKSFNAPSGLCVCVWRYVSHSASLIVAGAFSFEYISESLMTPCGHIFCGPCVSECINRKKVCPACNRVTEPDQVCLCSILFCISFESFFFNFIARLSLFSSWRRTSTPIDWWHWFWSKKMWRRKFILKSWLRAQAARTRIWQNRK